MNEQSLQLVTFEQAMALAYYRKETGCYYYHRQGVDCELYEFDSHQEAESAMLDDLLIIFENNSSL